MIGARSRYTLLSILLLLMSVARAQSFQQWVAWGDAAFARGEFYGATRFYDGAIAIDSGRMSLQWKQAEACRLSNQYKRAADLYARILQKDQGRTYPTCARWLAEMQLSTGAYREAEETWRRVIRKEKQERSFIALRAENALRGIAIALDSSKATGIVLEHLPKGVNSYESDFGARRGPDSLLYFSTLRGELNDDGEVRDTAAYRIALMNTPWPAEADKPALPLAPPMNVNGDNANITWTLDGKWALFTRCTPGSPCRIHRAAVSASGLGTAEPLPGMGDTLMSTQPMVANWADREMLLFVSDRGGGEGGMDIWQAELYDGKAENLYPIGKPVNTPGDERSPWYDPFTNTLWYSSDFLPGHGGFDIFSAAFGDDMFAGPVNAGRPINSPANDLYPVYDPLRGEGWLTSNRVGSFAAKGENCCNDLYRFTLTPEQPGPLAATPVPTNVSTERPVLTSSEAIIDLAKRFPLKLYFHNDEPEPRSWSTTTELAYSDCYSRYIALEPEYASANKDTSDIVHFFDEAVHKGYSDLAELATALWSVLEEGKSVTLETRGHASPLARTDYNRNLSRRRIESLRNHLRIVDNGRLRPYVENKAPNGAQLVIEELPFGEERAAAGVSDEPTDTERSIYSVGAASERRIEVIALQLHAATNGTDYDRRVAQLGTLTQGTERITRFTIENKGNSPMHLLHAEPDCGCTTAQLPTEAIEPGSTALVDVVFNGHAPDGPLRRTVGITTDGMPRRIELVIEGQVVP